MSYWQSVTQSRLSRRRLLAAGGASTAGALILAACGSSGSAGSGTPAADKSGLIYTPKDSTAQAKPGGTLKHYATADILHFDATADPSASTVALSSEAFYPRMLRMKPAKYPDQADGSSLGETAESWEVSPDKLTVTFKLRQGMKWDRRSPTNGRAIDAQDVLFSWNKYAKVNSTAPALVYDVKSAPDSPVESVTAPDAATIVVKLHQPYASIIPMFSARDIFYVEPKEADGGFDPRKTVRGHGMFILDNYTPSASFTYAKNPDFYMADRPFLDKVEVPIVTDQAQRLAQFKAGNIHTDVVNASQENVVVTKKDVPDALLTQDGNFPETSTNMLCFGWEQGGAWRDVRARQALSMLVDRQAYVDVIDNRAGFKQEGLDLPVRFNSLVAAGWGDYWLDPTDDKSFGPNAKYLNLNQAEAKKLWQAAGIASDYEVEVLYAGGGQYGPTYVKMAELFAGMFMDGGIKSKLSPINPQDHWLNDYSRVYRSATYAANPHGFTGVALIPERAYATCAIQVYNQFNNRGGGYRGAVLDNGKVTDGDAKCNDLTVQIIQEFDHAKQRDLVHQLIQYATGQMYTIPKVSAAKSFSLWWPVIGNLNVSVGYPGASNWVDLRSNWWIDDTKAPLKKS